MHTNLCTIYQVYFDTRYHILEIPEVAKIRLIGKTLLYNGTGYNAESAYYNRKDAENYINKIYTGKNILSV